MTKRLYVPEHVARKVNKPAGMEDLPKPVKTAFGKDQVESKNENDPSEMDASALE